MQIINQKEENNHILYKVKTNKGRIFNHALPKEKEAKQIKIELESLADLIDKNP